MNDFISISSPLAITILKTILREHDLHIVSEMPDFFFSRNIDFDNLSSIRNNLISISWDDVGEEWDEEKYGLINFEWKVEKRNIRNFELISTVSTDHPIKEAQLVFPEVQNYCLVVTGNNGGSCDLCSKSIETCFVPIEPISNIQITASRNTISPGGSIDFNAFAQQGTEIEWSYRVIPTSTVTNNPDTSKWSPIEFFPVEHVFELASEYEIEFRGSNSIRWIFKLTLLK